MRFLQFSGGKDSIACLLLMTPQLHDITVAWVNTGAAFPETLAQMKKVRARVPHFIEIKTNQPDQIADNGFPVDLLPVANHRHTIRLVADPRPMLQGFIECCATNIMVPMHEEMKRLGATEIIRGQRNDEFMKGKLRSGDVIDGVRYTFPLEHWTSDDVREFVKNSDLLTESYREGGNTSLDCWSCTAYLHENQWKLHYLEKHHPHWGAEVERRLTVIKHEVNNAYRFLPSAV